MAHQDGPHDHQDTGSDERGFVPPTTMTFLGTAAENVDDNNRGSSRIGSPVGMNAGEGKDAVPKAIQQGGDDGSASGGKADSGTSEGKQHLATGAAAAAGAAGDDSASNKGKSALAADDDGELKVHIIMERERRRRMKDKFNTLHELMPHVSNKVRPAILCVCYRAWSLLA